MRVLLAAALLVLLAFVPVASAAEFCVPRVIDGQNLACVDPQDRVNAFCLYLMVNPPLPGTYHHQTTCVNSFCDDGSVCRDLACRLVNPCRPLPLMGRVVTDG